MPTRLTRARSFPARLRLKVAGGNFLGGGWVGGGGISSPPLLFLLSEYYILCKTIIVQELCESRGGRPGLSVLTNLLVSVDVKNY